MKRIQSDVNCSSWSRAIQLRTILAADWPKAEIPLKFDQIGTGFFIHLTIKTNCTLFLQRLLEIYVRSVHVGEGGYLLKNQLSGYYSGTCYKIMAS